MSEQNQKSESDLQLEAIIKAWPHLTYWQRKRIVFLARWYIFKKKINKFISPWLLPSFAVRQIYKAFPEPTPINSYSKAGIEEVNENTE